MTKHDMVPVKLSPTDYFRIVEKCADEMGIPIESAIMFVQLLNKTAIDKTYPAKDGLPVMVAQPPQIM